MSDVPLPDRPLLTAHRRPHLDAELWRHARQPGLGLIGLVLVLPVAVLLSVGVGGPEGSVLVLGPLITFSLPVVAMIAFWWEDWPGSSLRPGWSGPADTLVIAFAGILLTMLAQAVVDRPDLRGVFDPTPGAGHAATFPATMSIGGGAFVAMLQITFAWEGWPLRRLGRIASGACALAVAWAAALVVHFAVERGGLLSGSELGALLVLTGLWQVGIYVVWRGWPFAGLGRRWVRILSANVVVVGGALLTYAAVHVAGEVRTDVITAVAGQLIAAGLVVGILFEGWLQSRLPPAAERVVSLAAVIVLAAVLSFALEAYAATLAWDRATADDWVGHVGLNALGLAVILHVAIARRWPFTSGSPS
ncbi:hypothetical protein E1286_22155 [Nonomuraea terrae]|uniref:Uncharacterized protein n=1 Tax=Nonomuraea terrae TaxID=2530383 RepID=A0A4R4YLX3_9ACTN|nr:hypothetical protein [Nonomuraea terrae]TDD46028.1 hypothetical protein E1286_22155 [Nonomuraea terrae]